MAKSSVQQIYSLLSTCINDIFNNKNTVVSTILNGLVVYVCLRKVKSLVSCDFYILNLAIIDICMPVFGFPLTIYSSFHHQWIVGEFRKYFFEQDTLPACSLTAGITGAGHAYPSESFDVGSGVFVGVYIVVCAAYGFIGFFCGVVSIATLAVISFARYLKVCGVEYAQTILTHTNYLIIGIYVYAGFWAFLPVFGVGAYGPEPFGTSCTLEWEGHQIFVTFFLILCVILPVIIMNVSYGRILLHIKQARRRTRRTIVNLGRPLKKRDSYLIKMTFTMCVGFVGLWSPYAVVSLWTAYGHQGEVPVRITLIAVLLAKLSTIVNPLVYFMLNKKFRPILIKYIDGISKKLKRGVFCTSS